MTENHPCAEVTTQPQGLVEIPSRDGQTYDHDRDGARLHKQHNRVFACMRDGAWRTLRQIAEATRDPEASISARLRDLRKERFGAHGVERRHVRDGLFEYRLIVNRPDLFSPPAGFAADISAPSTLTAVSDAVCQQRPIGLPESSCAGGTT